jgi:hypothetical protein
LRIGDWEGDAVVSTESRVHLVTLVDRCSKFLTWNYRINQGYCFGNGRQQHHVRHYLSGMGADPFGTETNRG